MIGAKVIGSISKSLDRKAKQLAAAYPRAMAKATKDLKMRSRRHVQAAGLGRKLAYSVRGDFYKNQGHNAAGLIYASAPKILGTFQRGATIKSADGFWLAIPTKAAPKRGEGGKRISPSTFPEHSLGNLRLVYGKGKRSAMLVVDGMVARAGKRGGFRKATVRRSKKRGDWVSLQGLATVPMFILVPQVRLKKRIRLKENWPKWADDATAAALKSEIRK